MIKFIKPSLEGVYILKECELWICEELLNKIMFAGTDKEFEEVGKAVKEAVDDRLEHIYEEEVEGRVI